MIYSGSFRLDYDRCDRYELFKDIKRNILDLNDSSIRQIIDYITMISGDKRNVCIIISYEHDNDNMFNIDVEMNHNEWVSFEEFHFNNKKEHDIIELDQLLITYKEII